MILKYDLTLSNATEIPDCVIKEAQKAANATLKGSGLTGASRNAAWARLKGDYIANWVKNQAGGIFKMKAPPPYTAGEHYVFKPSAFKAARPILTRISGEGSAKAVNILITSQHGFRISAGTANAIRVGGRILVVAAIAMDGYDILTAEEKGVAIVRVAGGWTGAIAGARLGAKGGAALAAFAGQMGPQVAVPEEVVTVPAAGIVGGLIGGMVGYFTGREVAETLYKYTNGFEYQ